MGIGARIAELRKAKRLSQRELARRTGMTQQYISQLETGLIENVGAAAVIQLAAELGTSTDYLLLGREGPPAMQPGWDGTERRRLPETARAVEQEAAHLDTASLRLLDDQCSVMVRYMAALRRAAVAPGQREHVAASTETADAGGYFKAN